MRSIGIRELRQNASRYLRDVSGRNESIEITDRGRPVARLVPVPSAGVLESLTEAGRLTEPAGDLVELEMPPAAGPGRPASDALERAREHER